MSSTGSEASKWTSVWPNSVTKQVGDTDPTSSMSSLSSLVEPLHRSSSIPSSSDRSTSISSGLLATMSMHSCLGKPLESWFQIYSSTMRPLSILFHVCLSVRASDFFDGPDHFPIFSQCNSSTRNLKSQNP